MTQEEVSVIYISQAQQLEAQGKYKEAEKLVSVDGIALRFMIFTKQSRCRHHSLCSLCVFNQVVLYS